MTKEEIRAYFHALGGPDRMAIIEAQGQTALEKFDELELLTRNSPWLLQDYPRDPRVSRRWLLLIEAWQMKNAA